MDEDVRRELDELRRRVAELENLLARLAGAAPVEPFPPDRDPLRHPRPPLPGDFPRAEARSIDTTGPSGRVAEAGSQPPKQVPKAAPMLSENHAGR